MFCPDCGYNNNDESTFCFACGALLKKTLHGGRYSIKKFLAKGGIEQVFLAYDEKMQAEIVIKQLIPNKEKESSNFEYLRGKVKEEATLLYRLSYRGLPKVMDFFEEQNNFFLTMQYIEGDDLDKYLESQPDKKIDYRTCIKWFDQILDVVAFLHNQNPPVIHRDIKPKNIMLDKTGELYLVDFNIACFLAENKNSYTKVGTVEYAAPESFTGKIDQRSDIYSLGATFFHLITGLSPSDREHPGSFPPVRTYVPEIPESVEIILKKMTSFSKDDRYSSCNEIREVLRQDPVVAALLAGIDIPPGQNTTDFQNVSLNGKAPVSGVKNRGFNPATVSSKKKSSVIKIMVAAVIIALIAAFSVYYSKTRSGDDNRNSTPKPDRYMVLAVSPQKDAISKMTAIADSKKMPAIMKLHFRYETQGNVFKVFTYYENRSDAVFALEKFKKDGIDAIIRENPIDGITIQIKSDFNTKTEAQAALDEVKNKNKNLDLYLVEKPVRLPIPIYQLIVTGIADEVQAEQLKAQFAEFSSDIKIEKE